MKNAAPQPGNDAGCGGPSDKHRRHPEVLALLQGEPRRMGHERLRPSFETPRKCAAPQDDGCCVLWSRAAYRLGPPSFLFTVALMSPSKRRPSVRNVADFFFRLCTSSSSDCTAGSSSAASM